MPIPVHLRNAALKVRRYSRLHHNHAGVVSLSADGTEVALTFDKALSLDKDYQVELLSTNTLLEAIEGPLPYSAIVCISMIMTVPLTMCCGARQVRALDAQGLCGRWWRAYTRALNSWRR